MTKFVMDPRMDGRIMEAIGSTDPELVRRVRDRMVQDFTLDEIKSLEDFLSAAQIAEALLNAEEGGS